jgi:phage FluMu gp28-like protein
MHALLVIEKSRRIGLTWGIAAEAVLTAGAARSAGGTNAYYISYSTDMTRDFIDACAMWTKAFGIAASAVQEELIEDGNDRKAIKTLSITFASGFRVQALSSAPRSLRGKQGLIIIDEAAYVDKLSELLKAAIAMLIWGGRVVVISTHSGKDNAFNQLIDEIRAGQRRGAVMRITFDDAIAQGLWERIKLVQPKTPSKAEWIALVRDTYGANAEEELDVIPAAGSGSYLNSADIAACAHPDAGNPDLYENGLCYHGRDIARRKDLNVDVTFEDVKGMLWQRELTAMQNATFREMDDEFDRRMKLYRIIRAGIDQTGMGEAVVERLIEKYGASVVEGYLFTSPNKLAIASALRGRFEERTIVIADCPILHADLRSIKRVAGTGEAVRLIEDGTSDAHADRFWAMGLACLVAGRPYQAYAYTPARSHDGERATRDMPGSQRGISGSRGLLG